jgi:eukaryotic-like serine/threonine-protein kinase
MNYRYEPQPFALGAEKAVHRAVCVETGAPVVIKFLRQPYLPTDLHHFKTEVERLRAVQGHGGSNVCSIVDWNTDVAPPFYVEEFFPDGTLAKKMAEIFAKGHVFLVGAAVGYCRQILEGLAHIHWRGQIHRDIKPSNILWHAAGKRLTITDMGIGRTLARPTELQTRAFRGTRGYAPPEQELGLQVDHKVDLYAVGVIMHEMLTGKRGGHDYVTYNAHAGVAALIRSLLSRNPSFRPISARAVLETIKRLGVATR